MKRHMTRPDLARDQRRLKGLLDLELSCGAVAEDETLSERDHEHRLAIGREHRLVAPRARLHALLELECALGPLHLEERCASLPVTSDPELRARHRRRKAHKMHAVTGGVDALQVLKAPGSRCPLQAWQSGARGRAPRRPHRGARARCHATCSLSARPARRAPAR